MCEMLVPLFKHQNGHHTSQGLCSSLLPNILPLHPALTTGLLPTQVTVPSLAALELHVTDNQGAAATVPAPE